MKLLAAIDVVLTLLGAIIAAKPKESDDYSRVNELLTQLKTLGEAGLGRLLQRMSYVREVLTRSTLPTLDDLKTFLNQVVQVIDCDAKPFIPDDWEVVEHQKGGKLEWNPEKIQLYLSNGQKDGKCIDGNRLRKELKGKRKRVLNVCVLDWLLAHPEFIPEEWRKERAVFFFGTVYRDAGGGLWVRYLLFWAGDDGKECCGWGFGWLGSGVCCGGPVAVLVS